MAKQKKKSDFENKVLSIRLILTAVLAVAFVFIFVFCGGIILLTGQVGNVKCFIDNDFEVHFIDVGQGDSIFIKFPDKTTMLIDAGPDSSSEIICDYLEDLFKQEKINKIDSFIITHQDSDHTGGADEVFKKFQINYFYRPMVLSTYEVENFSNPNNYKISESNTYDEAIVASYNEPNCIMRYSFAGITWGNNKYSVKFLSPNKTSYSNSNNYSPIIKITYQSRSFLFTGDAETVAENEVIETSSALLEADVLKVSHHGASNGTSSNFLNYVKPAVAIISVGRGNSYGHPADETILRLQNLGCKIYQTAYKGAIAMSVDSKGNIIMGGKNNMPAVDMTIIICVFIIAVLIVWGVKVKEEDIKRIKYKKSARKK